MKKYSFLVLALITLINCQDTVRFNNPAVQANNEGQSWQSDTWNATIKDDGLIIRGTRGTEVLLLFTTRTDAGDYPLGDVNVSEARFILSDGTTYSTLNAPDPSVQVFPSDGLIQITNVDTTLNLATGEFWFNAFTEDGLESVNFIDGVFFEIPINDLIEEATGGTTCTLATAAVDAFEPGLATRIVSVDDCTQYNSLLTTQLLACEDTDGSIQAKLDALDCLDEDEDGVPNSYEDVDMDGDVENDDTDGDGIPNYMDDDDDGDGLLTVTETFDTDGLSVDTDGDDIYNYLDADDDGDGILTAFENIDPDMDGDFSDAQDSDMDAIPDYLDADDDGDGVNTIDENADPDVNGDPADATDTDMDDTPDYLDTDDDGDDLLTIFEDGANALDTDMDGVADYLDDDDGLLTIFEAAMTPMDADFDTIPNYLDNDDDNDGILTMDENADPDGDGDPADAVDTDMNGVPDYLQP